MLEVEPLGQPMRHVFSYSSRRCCDRMTRFPRGLLPMGDALASVNPICGQGMTLAAQQVVALSAER